MVRSTLVAGLVACSSASAFGQSFAISWFSIDGGGGSSASASFALRGTIAQHDVGPRSLNSGLSLAGGFWGAPTDAVPTCVADVDDGSGTGLPDGGVTIEDLLFYLVVFGNGGLAGDVDDGSGTGTRDGGVTIEDLLYFLVRFENGC